MENSASVDVDTNSSGRSLKAVEGFLGQLNGSKTQLEKLWRGKQQKLDNWVELKRFERECNNTIKRQSEWIHNWESRTLAGDLTKLQVMLQKFTAESPEMDKGIDRIYTKGESVLQILHNCGVEVTLTDDKGIKIDSLEYMKNTLKSLGERKGELLASRQKIHRKLEQCVQLRRLELDAKRVAGWIRHGENILQANVEAGSSLLEAEALLREYEQFQISIEVRFNNFSFL